MTRAHNDHDADDKGGKKPKISEFVKRAKAKGMSPKAFAKANIHADGPIGKAARLAYTIQNTHGEGAASMKGPGDTRTPAQKLYQIG